MTNINYTATYFIYPSPTPVYGKPTKKLFKRLKTELCANTSSVDTELEGCYHCYLGLIISDAEYV